MSERTDRPREVVEAVLAHVVRNQTEAAYARSDLFDRRQQIREVAYDGNTSSLPVVGEPGLEINKTDDGLYTVTVTGWLEYNHVSPYPSAVEDPHGYIRSEVLLEFGGRTSSIRTSSTRSLLTWPPCPRRPAAARPRRARRPRTP